MASQTTETLSWFQWVEAPNQGLQFSHINFRTQSVKICLFPQKPTWTQKDFSWAKTVAWYFTYREKS